MTPPLLALEEHYYSRAIFDAIGEPFQRTLQGVPGLADQLRGLDVGRLEAMSRGNIALQVVSHAFTPGGPSVDACRAGNDELAADIARISDPQRFAAFAVLPVADAAASASELDRAVSQLGFVGALIDNHADGKHYDGPEYDVLWAKACDLDVPIYLHPTWPSADMTGHYMGSYPVPVGMSLGGPGWGWHPDVGLHVLKLFAAGVFDRFPQLKIIIGHMGEMLPFMLERASDMSTRWAGWGVKDRSLRQVWDENIWITTSGSWSLAPMKCILHNTKVDRIMYSVDYPFESNERGLEWFKELEASGLLTEEQLEMVAHRNAEKLLKVQVRAD
ncbi:amidohydrolase family protein [Aspergillus mulundensis]|uniref:Decarboxylase orsB n=1 Tax=Aspergillus mulundensis TaxID=1810919 RepID=A0A3D8T2A3_9EURO|nr:Decarboxylase orsB [Aspergillus mulundensis]RDW92686.1 Decarboxylase orsB [Aspergillus mulundensis]